MSEESANKFFLRCTKENRGKVIDLIDNFFGKYGASWGDWVATVKTLCKIIKEEEKRQNTSGFEQAICPTCGGEYMTHQDNCPDWVA